MTTKTSDSSWLDHSDYSDSSDYYSDCTLCIFVYRNSFARNRPITYFIFLCHPKGFPRIGLMWLSFYFHLLFDLRHQGWSESRVQVGTHIPSRTTKSHRSTRFLHCMEDHQNIYKNSSYITHIASFKVNTTSEHWNFPHVLGFYWPPSVHAMRFWGVFLPERLASHPSKSWTPAENRAVLEVLRVKRNRQSPPHGACDGFFTRWEVLGKSLVESVWLTIRHAIAEERIELPTSSTFHCVFCHFNWFHTSHTTFHTWAGCKPLLPELCLYCIEVDLWIDDICLHWSTRVEMQKPEQVAAWTCVISLRFLKAFQQSPKNWKRSLNKLIATKWFMAFWLLGWNSVEASWDHLGYCPLSAPAMQAEENS